MMARDNEEDELRSVALQNARSILIARQRAEEALRKQTDWLRVMLASIGDAVISTDAEGRVRFMNRVAESLTGWPEADAIGRPLPDILQIVNEWNREVSENPALRALRKGTTVSLARHTILIARDGTERLIDDSAAPILDDTSTPIGAVLVFRDVSDRKEAETVRARLAAIVESSEDAIISKSLDGVIRSWNAGAVRLFGYAAHEAIGQPITLIIPMDRRDEERVILQRISRGERIEHFETMRVSKQGRLIHISLTVSPISDAAGNIIGASKIARDISDRKSAERQLREAGRKKDQFIALLAHELRNPLAPLRNGLQVMRLAGGNLDASAEALAMMERQLGHMVRLIDDLLDISRIGQNKMELRRSRVLLTDVLSSAVESARPAIDEAEHKLTISLPPDPIPLDADLTRLSQVFTNLLTNSAKYTERGGAIWLTAERQRGEVVVSVRDNGIGIPEDALPRIFDMFSQVDESIARSQGGLGIGLALVKALTEMHGGTIDVASGGTGQGSTFSVRLPTLGGVAEPTATVWSESEQRSDGSLRRILVVDDNRDGADSMALMCKLGGSEARAAYNGFQALELAETFRPTVILMDIGMPKLNGYEVTRRIREQPWGQEILIIALTGWGQDLDRTQSRDAGCNGHLVKPVTPPDLEQLLLELEATPPRE
jgi:PAS domain S-box-containing protein